MRVPGEEAIRRQRGELIAIRALRGEREALLHQSPEIFFTTPHWETNSSVLAWLRDVDDEELRELILEAWLAVAPKQLVRDLESRAVVAPRAHEVETPHGPAMVHIHNADEPVGAVVLGHGAGGRVNAPDLIAAVGAAAANRFAAVLVEQPYSVAGRRSPAPARQLDEAWKVVVASLREAELRDLPIITGGRSAGARVACRTSAECGAIAVLCLAFPLRPPRRKADGDSPAPTRQHELDGVSVPMLVVQGRSDQFGVPESSGERTVITVPGNHSLAADPGAVRAAVAEWLAGLIESGSLARRASPTGR
jgi:predicted alpha/beta-hydrolase family hydrolase